MRETGPATASFSNGDDPAPRRVFSSKNGRKQPPGNIKMAKKTAEIGFWHSVFPNQLGNLCFIVFLVSVGLFLLYGMFDLNVFDPDSFHRAKSAPSSDGGAPAIPELGTRRVVDEAGVLTPGEIEALTREIDAFEAASGGQMAVLLVRSLNGTPVEEYSLSVAEKWKIGRKGIDNGVLLLLAVDDQRNRMEIGDGWEGVVNDARAGDVLRGMAPVLKQKHYAEAISYAIRCTAAFVRNEPVPDVPIGDISDGPENTLIGFIGICLLGVVIGTVAACIMIRPGVRKSVGLVALILLARFILEVLILAARSSGRSGGGRSDGGRSRSGGGGGRFSGGGASGRW